jgi:hypothetical protein
MGEHGDADIAALAAHWVDNPSRPGGERLMHRHHLSGRPGPGLPYFDAQLVVVLDPVAHVAEHVAIRRAGLQWPAPGDELSHRLLRVADHATRRGLQLGPGASWALVELLVEAAVVVRRLRGATS